MRYYYQVIWIGRLISEAYYLMSRDGTIWIKHVNSEETLQFYIHNIKIKGILIGVVDRIFANGQRDRGSIPGQFIPKTQKMVLDASLLNTQHYEVLIKVKWSNPDKRVAPSHYTLLK